MNYDNILFEQTGAIATITINRPSKLNALNSATLNELSVAMERVYEDDTIGGVLVTGAGEKAFIAGADISEFLNLGVEEARALARSGQALFDTIEQSPKPVIALVNGFALGGGCELAMACHFRYAADTARFGQPEVNLGLIPGYGGTQRLPRLIGKGRALELILNGEMISAEAAEQMGLVNKVVPANKLAEEGREGLSKILNKGPLAIRYAIDVVNRGLSMPLKQGLQLEADYFATCFGTEDMKEGTMAFMDKRKAQFKGK